MTPDASAVVTFHRNHWKGSPEYAETRGIAVTSLSPIGCWRLRTEQGDDGLYYNKLSALEPDHPDIVDGTDVWALNRGLISLTPLRLEVTDDTLLPALSEQARRLESALELIVVEVP